MIIFQCLNSQARIIRGLKERRGGETVAIGLEMVQQQFQPALDRF